MDFGKIILQLKKEGISLDIDVSQSLGVRFTFRIEHNNQLYKLQHIVPQHHIMLIDDILISAILELKAQLK